MFTCSGKQSKEVRKVESNFSPRERGESDQEIDTEP